MPETVQLFITCLIDSFFPRIGEAMVTVLNRAGLRVDFPSAQTCCGQPAHSSGFPDEARAVALQQLNLFTEAWPIVVPRTSSR